MQNVVPTGFAFTAACKLAPGNTVTPEHDDARRRRRRRRRRTEAAAAAAAEAAEAAEAEAEEAAARGGGGGGGGGGPLHGLVLVTPVASARLEAFPAAS